jgi:hypothetical protein
MSLPYPDEFIAARVIRTAVLSRSPHVLPVIKSTVERSYVILHVQQLRRNVSPLMASVN